MVLGVMDGIEIQGARTTLDPTDHLLLYTDGVPEAADSAGQEYGEDRLLDFLLKQKCTSQSDLLDQLIARVIAHCGDNRPHDDMTMISVIRRRPQVDVMNPVIPPPIPTSYA
jgi:sigma-B regulation protein RsbU (phosphoserine phosphatase)